MAGHGCLHDGRRRPYGIAFPVGAIAVVGNLLILAFVIMILAG
ncbi:MAG: hypothetical protein ACRDWS_00440 [Acidimicrobiia bacterium]